VGAACHQGYYSCFYREIQDNGQKLEIVKEKVFAPEKVYGE
jgi:phosphoribosyl-AMP cyclohydrolase